MLTPWQALKKNFYGYSLMLWDGLGFFGTDHTKLGRLKGEKVDFYTPFKCFRKMILMLILLSVTIYILVTEISKLGT